MNPRIIIKPSTTKIHSFIDHNIYQYSFLYYHKVMIFVNADQYVHNCLKVTFIYIHLNATIVKEGHCIKYLSRYTRFPIDGPQIRLVL